MSKPLIRIAIIAYFLGLLSSVSQFSMAEEFRWNEVTTGTTVSLRGLSAADDGSVWAGGKGEVLMSRDQGRTGTWRTIAVSGFEELEFRSVHAWNADRVCIASAGTPAVILLTEDGGTTWSEAYRDPSPQAFFDALAFAGAVSQTLAELTHQHGYALSDPVDGQWLLLETFNGGRDWLKVEHAPKALEKEAAFAASNGSLALWDTHLWLGTGGATTSPKDNLLQWDGDRWQRKTSSIASGESAGVFAIHFWSSDLGVALGGDYKQEDDATVGASWTEDGGNTWHPSFKHPSGFRSSVCSVPSDETTTLFAVGPNGTDRSYDGKNWERISETGFHTIRALPDGTLIAVGSNGRFGWCKPKTK